MTAKVAGEGSTTIPNPARPSFAVKPIRTLIDPRLDFKVPTPLRKSYIVASSMRSGSTFLCTELWRTGVLGAPWEYINSDNELGNLKARYKASTFAEYLPRLLARRTSKNGVFGMKAHFHHFRAAIEEYPQLLENLKPVTFVYIDRLDKLAQAVSMAKARQTKSWISLLPSDRPSPEYNADLITKDLESAERQARAWHAWFANNNVTPFTVTYEDMQDDAARVVRSIVEWLGVENDDPDVVALPPVRKQADETNEAWVARYRNEMGGDADMRARWGPPEKRRPVRAEPSPAPEQSQEAANGPAVNELMDLAWMAFIYGFPSYEMARLRYRALTGAAAGQRAAQPNTFRHARKLINPAISQNSANNTDTIYSGAWLDLSQGPLLIHIPEMGDRYFSLQFMDFFTNNFAVLGPDTEAGDYLIAGPQWNGAPPEGTKFIQSPTDAVWATLRILVDDPDDLPSIHTLQDQFAIKAAAQPAPESAPASDARAMPVLPMEQAEPLRFFDILNAVLTENPPPERDKDLLAWLRPIGVGPSLQFDRGMFNDAQRGALRAGLASARDTIRNLGPAAGGRETSAPRGTLQRRQNGGLMHQPTPALIGLMRGPQDEIGPQRPPAQTGGWSQPPLQAGNFGRNYLLRARFALVGIGALPRDQAMYFTTTTDANGQPLDGHGNYALRFPPNGQPPVEAFWSLTVYRTDENRRRWLVPNTINRYSIGARTRSLRYDSDGTLQILIQHNRPAAMAENWLPVGEGPFLLTLRTYQPGRALIDGQYEIPLPVKADSTEQKTP